MSKKLLTGFAAFVMKKNEAAQFFNSREQRAERTYLHAHLATVARVIYPAVLQYCKIEAPLHAAGLLILWICRSKKEGEECGGFVKIKAFNLKYRYSLTDWYVLDRVNLTTIMGKSCLCQRERRRKEENGVYSRLYKEQAKWYNR